MVKECDVCGGEGRCPIFDIHGNERYNVECPECAGTGDGRSLEDWMADNEAAAFAATQKAKYDTIMAEKRKARSE